MTYYIKTILFAGSLLVFSCTKTTNRPDVKPGIEIQKPEENRFTKTVLVEPLKEPMELAVDNMGTVYWVERYGDMYSYNPQTGKSILAGKLNVFTGNNDGLLGLTLDPDFETNQFAYLYYSPAGSTPKQHVSRFILKDGKLDRASERVILQIPTQRELCCHSAGSLEFGPEGNLYIAVGDNTNPWEQQGYAPLDERPGKENWDVQRTAANTNDLRGKILRIHPEPDGTYTIPDGNLFPKDGSRGKPEIYVMGVRNPFRISVDKTGRLFFGDIGPDANVSSERGPSAQDEFNITDKPGNFGWPYFVGDNKAYPDFDFATNTVGPVQNPEFPINNSPNNTGEKNLPPAVKPIIWYGPEKSKEFPNIGEGGRSGIGGPIYDFNPDLDSDVKFPEYYHNTFFIGEWMRDWIKVVQLKSNTLDTIEDFMPSTEFSSPIDLAWGPDGALYVLEYGKGWYSNNNDSKLSRITFNKGNRPPVAKATASTYAGKLPLKVHFSGAGTVDFDADKLSYRWEYFKDSTLVGSSGTQEADFTFTEPGIYKIKLTAKDTEGKTAETSFDVIAGNTPPVVKIDIRGNQKFFWEGPPVKYALNVTDSEDGTLGSGIDPTSVQFFVDYSPGGSNLSPLITSRQKEIVHPGKALIDGSDCKSCHFADKESVGPSFVEIAKRYKNDAHALEKLSEKIIQGGGGNWNSKFVMIAHPQISESQAAEMVNYILTIDQGKIGRRKLAASGNIELNRPDKDNTNGYFLFTAIYSDKGGEGVQSISDTAWTVLSFPRIQAEDYASVNRMKGLGAEEDGDARYLGNTQNGSYSSYKGIDFTNVGALVFNVATNVRGITIEVHIDSESGPLIGTADLGVGKGFDQWKQVSAAIKATEGVRDLYIVTKGNGGKERSIVNIDWIQFEQSKK